MAIKFIIVYRSKKKDKKERKYYFVARSSITGRFVSLEYAKKHPKTTEIEKRRK